MKLRDEDLELAMRKALVARLLRARAEIGAIEESEHLVLLGRIEQARSREEVDAIQAEIESLPSAAIRKPL